MKFPHVQRVVGHLVCYFVYQLLIRQQYGQTKALLKIRGFPGDGKGHLDCFRSSHKHHGEVISLRI